MPRFFFSLDNHGSDVDDEGTELAGPEVARIAAVMYLGEYLRDHPGVVWDGHTLAVLVENEDHERIFRVKVQSDEDTI